MVPVSLAVGMQCFYRWSKRLMASMKDLFHRMKRRDFLFWLPALLSLCFSELCGRHGRISCSVWVGRISGKLREQQQISAHVQVSCRFRQKCCETFFTSRPPRCDVVLQLNVQNKIRSNSKIWFLFQILSVWSPVQQRSLLRSPARCQHLLCPSPWQWVSVPSLSVCLLLFLASSLFLMFPNLFCDMNHCGVWRTWFTTAEQHILFSHSDKKGSKMPTNKMDLISFGAEL